MSYHDLEHTDLSLVDGARIIDVRELHEFHGELGHLRRAELVPLGTLEAQAAPWKRDQALLVVCRSGARSARAAQLLVSMGFTHVYNLLGGMLAYRAANPSVAA